jgi:hypothetical protein
VARVGDELPHLALARLAGEQCRLHVIEHAREGGAQLPDLGARVGVDRLEPVGERDGAAIERQLGHARRRLANAREGSQRDARDTAPEGRRDDEGADEHGRDRRAEPRGRDRRLPRGEPDHDSGALTDGSAEHAVLAEAPGEADGARLLDRGSRENALLQRRQLAHLGIEVEVGGRHATLRRDDGDERAERQSGAEQAAARLPRPRLERDGDALRGRAQLVVELTDERGAQREGAHDADAERRDREQSEDARDEPLLEGPAAHPQVPVLMRRAVTRPALTRPA